MPESSPQTDDTVSTPAAPQDTPAARRRGAVSFVAVFLVATVALLVLARYTVNTPFVNWYLFQVARSTSWALGLIGESSSLEDPQMYEGREGSIRAALAGAAAEESSKEMRSPKDGQPPLTAYEVWLYRSLLLERQSEQTRAAIQETRPREGVIPANEPQRVAALRNDFDRLATSTRQDSPAGRMQVMPPQMGELLKAAEDALRQLENNTLPAQASRSALLAELETKIAGALAQQNEFLRARAAQLSMQEYDRHGPTVSYVAKAGLAAQLRLAEAELARTPLASHGNRAEQLRAQVEALKAQRAAATSPAELAILDRDVRFHFNVVPDCGALPSMAIFVAAILAFPARLWKKLVGMLLGIPALYIINVARLACLAVIGAYWGNGKEFEFAHEYVWQAVYIIFVVMVWLLWVELLVRPGGIWRKKTA
ncbi:MAG: archaeosortase/exosortase family protein [Candidatus Hydrogenedentes bacterium]|nr:archaeosortase/exosortase family protein [Candidatus Hydrogenedentota bacterium]